MAKSKSKSKLTSEKQQVVRQDTSTEDFGDGDSGDELFASFRQKEVEEKQAKSQEEKDKNFLYASIFEAISSGINLSSDLKKFPDICNNINEIFKFNEDKIDFNYKHNGYTITEYFYLLKEKLVITEDYTKKDQKEKNNIHVRINVIERKLKNSFREQKKELLYAEIFDAIYSLDLSKIKKIFENKGGKIEFYYIYQGFTVDKYFESLREYRFNEMIEENKAAGFDSYYATADKITEMEKFLNDSRLSYDEEFTRLLLGADSDCELDDDLQFRLSFEKSELQTKPESGPNPESELEPEPEPELEVEKNSRCLRNLNNSEIIIPSLFYQVGVDIKLTVNSSYSRTNSKYDLVVLPNTRLTNKTIEEILAYKNGSGQNLLHIAAANGDFEIFDIIVYELYKLYKLVEVAAEEAIASLENLDRSLSRVTFQKEKAQLEEEKGKLELVVDHKSRERAKAYHKYITDLIFKEDEFECNIADYAKAFKHNKILDWLRKNKDFVEFVDKSSKDSIDYPYIEEFAFNHYEDLPASVQAIRRLLSMSTDEPWIDKPYMKSKVTVKLPSYIKVYNVTNPLWVSHSNYMQHNLTIDKDDRFDLDWRYHFLIHEGFIHFKKYAEAEDKSKSKINSADNRGMAPLHLALRLGKFELVRYILSLERAKIDLKDCYGNSVLHYAIPVADKEYGETSLFCRLQILSVLLDKFTEKKIPTNTVNIYGENFTDLVKILPENTRCFYQELIDIKCNGKSIKNTESYAVNVLFSNIVKEQDLSLTPQRAIYILLKYDKDSLNKLLHLVYDKYIEDKEKNDVTYLKKWLVFLLTIGADINSLDHNKQGYSILHKILNHHLREIDEKRSTELLAIKKNTRGGVDGKLIEIYLINFRKGLVYIGYDVKEFADFGGDVNIKDVRSDTIEQSLFRQILDHNITKGEIPYIQDEVVFFLETPLPIPSSTDYLNLKRREYVFNVSCRALTSSGTILDLARANGFNANASLHGAIELGDIEKIIYWLQAGADPNALDKDGKSSLELAFKSSKYEEIFKLLIGNKIVPLDHKLVEDFYQKLSEIMALVSRNREADKKDAVNAITSLEASISIIDLKKNNSDLENKIKEGLVLLIRAILKRDVEELKKTIILGREVCSSEIRDFVAKEFGPFLLHIAIYPNFTSETTEIRKNIRAILIEENKIDINAKSPGETEFMKFLKYLEYFKKSDLKEKLLFREKDSSILHATIILGGIEEIIYYLNMGANPNPENPEEAVFYKKVECFCKILEKYIKSQPKNISSLGNSNPANASTSGASASAPAEIKTGNNSTAKVSSLASSTSGASASAPATKFSQVLARKTLDIRGEDKISEGGDEWTRVVSKTGKAGRSLGASASGDRGRGRDHGPVRGRGRGSGHYVPPGARHTKQE